MTDHRLLAIHTMGDWVEGKHSSGPRRLPTPEEIRDIIRRFREMADDEPVEIRTVYLGHGEW